jgi:hypothetical protein
VQVLSVEIASLGAVADRASKLKTPKIKIYALKIHALFESSMSHP